MRTKKLPVLERLMIFLGMFCFGVLFYRCFFTWNLHYTFLLWNLLIAFVPYIISKQLLKCKELNIKAILLLFAWMLFFPVCIYLFTDILQMHNSDNFYSLYDGLLFLSFGFTGLLPGFISLRQIEMFLAKHLPGFLVKASILFFIFLSSYGICLVRFLHLKNWNIIVDFKKLFHVSEKDILNPEHHVSIWLSIFILVVLIDILYAGFKKLYYLKTPVFRIK
ncbi:MAG TPA: DUF1361 domain-containing protein [Parafilimonas sp.]|nr:DUF1361 domain-containing protein [Parafilimonas sp.]